MSLTTFENTNLDFDVSIIKMARKQNRSDGIVYDYVDSVTPIDAAAVVNLDLRESSLTMGFVGTISINNKFKILDTLNITTNSPYDVYIAIKITDTDLLSIDGVPDEDKCVTVVGYINNTSAGAMTIIDSIVTFEFEEAFVAALKKTRIEDFIENTSKEYYDVVEIVNEFNRRKYKLKDGEKVTTVDTSSQTDHYPNVKHKLLATWHSYSVSVYDAVQQMLSESTAGQYQKTAYFRFVNRVNDEGEIVRQLQYAPFLTNRHIQFVHTIANDKQFVKGFKSGDVSSDFSDVYLEKFTLGPLSDTQDGDANINMYNKIESYNITRANAGILKESTWGNYNIERASPTNDRGMVTGEIISFSHLLRQFAYTSVGINGEALEVGLNLPLLVPSSLKDFRLFNDSMSSPEEDKNSITYIKNKIYNKVHKSFLTINETITFKVKGSIIRRPNMFIWIENGTSEENYKKLWYVNSVNHVFGSGNYTTEIVATKIFGDTTLDAIDANEIQNPSPGVIYDNINVSNTNMV